MAMIESPNAQIDKLRDLARDLMTDESEKELDEKVKRLAKARTPKLPAHQAS